MKFPTGFTVYISKFTRLRTVSRQQHCSCLDMFQKYMTSKSRSIRCDHPVQIETVTLMAQSTAIKSP